jgi:type I restriction enzyme S subunit
MVDGGISFNSLDHIPESSRKKYEKHILKKGDLVVATVGSHPTQPNSVVGRTSIIPTQGDDHLLNQNAVCVRVFDDDIDLHPLFLFYLTQTTHFKHYAATRAKGSANQVRLAISELKKYTFPAPPLPLQTRIADLLSAYDELIEVNNRRIALLEQTAEQLYKEWFVRLRFPGYAQTKVRKGVPEGWVSGKLSQICQVNQRSLRKHKAPAIIKYIDISSVSTNHISHVEEMKFSDAPSRARRIVKHNDVIWSSVRPSRRSFAKIVSPPSNLVVSTGFTVLSPNKPYENYIFLYSTHKSFAKYLSAVAKGSAYPAVSANDFENADILIPPVDLIQQFNDKVEPMIQMINTLQTQNQTLRRTRDLLLPRLISGQLSVAEAETALNA